MVLCSRTPAAFLSGLFAGICIGFGLGPASGGGLSIKTGEIRDQGLAVRLPEPSQDDVHESENYLGKFFGPPRGVTHGTPPPGKRLVQKWTPYIATYARYLTQYRCRPELNVLELGVKEGGSLLMWLDFFGPGARITGVDRNPAASKFAGPRTKIMIGDISSKQFLHRICDEAGPFDYILDDCSHLNDHQRLAHSILYTCLKTNGIYMVEDIDTSYKKRFGGLSEQSFVQYAFDRVNDLNAYWSCQSVTSMTDDEKCGCDAGADYKPPHSECSIRDGDEPFYNPSDFTRTTHAIYFHDGIVVFDKRSHDSVPKSIYGYVGDVIPSSGTTEQCRER